MKHFTFIFLTVLLSSACSTKPAAYYVNPNKLLQGYHGATTQYELFQAKAQVWQQHIDFLSTELQALNQAPAATCATKEQQLLRYRDAIR